MSSANETGIRKDHLTDEEPINGHRQRIRELPSERIYETFLLVGITFSAQRSTQPAPLAAF